MLDADFAAQFARLGVEIDEEMVMEEEAMPIWAANWRSVKAFLACETQWRIVAGFGAAARLGIDYQAARPLYERRNGRVDRRLFDDIRVMERAALEAFAEVAE